MKKFLFCLICLITVLSSAYAQEGWVMKADSRKDYNGATMANGRLGVVTDDRPFTAREIVLAGVFDKEGYNGVSRVARGPVYNRQNDLWGKSKRNATKRLQNEMRQKFSLFPIKKHCSEGYLKPI